MIGLLLREALDRLCVRLNMYLVTGHSNFFSIFTRFRDIAAFVLQNAIFLTSPLLSPKFPHVPLGIGGCPLGYGEKSEGVGLIVRAISFQDFQPM